MSAPQETVAETLCSALYQMPFSEFLGETDVTEKASGWYGHCMWFHLGEKPKDMRVTVYMPREGLPEVQVILEWYNFFTDGRRPLKGSQTLHVSATSYNTADLQDAAERTLLTILERFKEVLSETGVAGRISDLTEEVTDG